MRVCVCALGVVLALASMNLELQEPVVSSRGRQMSCILVRITFLDR